METIYGWLSFLYETDYFPTLAFLQESNLIQIIGISTLIIAIVVCVVYYYALNHTRWNRWWHWLIFLLGVVAISFFLAFGISHSNLLANDSVWGAIYDRSLNITTYTVYYACLGLGFANAFISIVFFTICSFIIKWGSHNCKHSPF